MNIADFKNKVQKNIHDGHRARMRESVYVKNGFDGMADHEVLEYILSMFVPRKDTNPMAHELINYFGSFANVLDANVDDLIKVSGLGKRTAIFLNSFQYILKRYKECKSKTLKIISNLHDIEMFIGDRIRYLPKEELHVIFLNSSNMLLTCKQIGTGSNNKVTFETKSIIETALATNASSVVLVHNHPSGSCTPSPEDIKLTRELYFNLYLNGLNLAEHIIFTANSKYSFNEGGHLLTFHQECDKWYNGATFKTTNLGNK